MALVESHFAEGIRSYRALNSKPYEFGARPGCLTSFGDHLFASFPDGTVSMTKSGSARSTVLFRVPFSPTGLAVDDSGAVLVVYSSHFVTYLSIRSVVSTTDPPSSAIWSLPAAVLNVTGAGLPTPIACVRSAGIRVFAFQADDGRVSLLPFHDASSSTGESRAPTVGSNSLAETPSALPNSVPKSLFSSTSTQPTARTVAGLFGKAGGGESRAALSADGSAPAASVFGPSLSAVSQHSIMSPSFTNIHTAMQCKDNGCGQAAALSQAAATAGAVDVGQVIAGVATMVIDRDTSSRLVACVPLLPPPAGVAVCAAGGGAAARPIAAGRYVAVHEDASVRVYTLPSFSVGECGSEGDGGVASAVYGTRVSTPAPFGDAAVSCCRVEVLLEGFGAVSAVTSRGDRTDGVRFKADAVVCGSQGKALVVAVATSAEVVLFSVPSQAPSKKGSTDEVSATLVCFATTPTAVPLTRRGIEVGARTPVSVLSRARVYESAPPRALATHVTLTLLQGVDGKASQSVPQRVWLAHTSPVGVVAISGNVSSSSPQWAVEPVVSADLHSLPAELNGRVCVSPILGVAAAASCANAADASEREEVGELHVPRVALSMSLPPPLSESAGDASGEQGGAGAICVPMMVVSLPAARPLMLSEAPFQLRAAVLRRRVAPADADAEVHDLLPHSAGLVRKKGEALVRTVLPSEMESLALAEATDENYSFLDAWIQRTVDESDAPNSAVLAVRQLSRAVKG